MNQKLSKHLLIGILFLSLSTVAQSQSTSNVPSVIPPSPNASELGKYGDVPVNLFTGGVSQNIPLTEISIGNFTLPISLSYGSGGIRVSQEASHVGLGWSLNAGGVITRSVVGLPDEEYYITSGAKTVPTTGEMEPKDDYAYYLGLSENNNYDSQPDMFYYNFNGKSGRFFFDQNKVAFTAKHDNIKITWVNTGKFEIIVESGYKYVFEETEMSSNDNKLGTIYYFPSAWYLSKICLPNDTEIAHFNYTSYSTQTKQYQSKSFTHSKSIWGPAALVYYCAQDLPEDPGGTFVTSIEAKILNDIVFRTGKVEFETSTRQDHLWEKKIDKISISNNAGKIKEFAFLYSYFNNNVSISEPEFKRLKLEKVAIKDKASSTVSEYQFSYEETISLPQKSSWSQDHWGFYNGKSNPHLVPTYKYTYYDNTGAWPREITGADRSTDFAYMKAGVLTNIKYPTGGSTKFTYEANDVGGGTELRYPEIQTTKSVTTNIVNGIYTSELTFSINKDVTNAIIHASFPAKDYLDENGIKCSPTFSFVNVTEGETVLNINNFSFTQDVFDGSVTLQKDNVYKIKVNESDSRCYNSQTYTAYLESNLSVIFSDINISAPQVEVDIPKRKVGGLRIKKIENYNNFNESIETRSFDYSQGYNLSSGVLLEEPIYSYEYQIYVEDPNSPPGTAACPNASCSFIMRAATSYIELGTVQGSHICYPKVTEILGQAGENGKVVYEYSYVSDPGGANNSPGVYPFPPASSYDFFRGNLLKQTSYNVNNQKVNEITNQYDSKVLNTIAAMKVAKKFGGLEYLLCLNPAIFIDPLPFYDNFFNPNYYLINGISRIKETSDITYSSAGQIETVTKYEYFHDNTLPSKIETKLSKSDTKIEYTSYYLDYTPGNSEIDYLRNKSILSPVEKVQIVKRQDGSIWVANGQYTKYSPTMGWLPIEIYGTELGAPIALTNWKFSNRAAGLLPELGAVGGFSLSPEYKKQAQIGEYDSWGNAGFSKKESDNSTAYQWSYDNSLPIAQATNALKKDIFHTSFEDSDGNSTDNDSKTGRKSKTNGYSKSLTNLTDGDYILSYWKKTGSVWSLQKSTVPVSGGIYPISLSGQVDEVRFYPKGSKMTTYTYDPLIGITSQCDINNRVTYYEYDGLGRLSIVKDEDRNILKRYCYNYQGQTETCVAANQAPLLERASSRIMKEKETLTMKFRATDNDGGYLLWTILHLPGFATVHDTLIGSVYECTVSFVNPTWGTYGDFPLTVRVEDGRGGVDSLNLTVTILQVPITGPTDDGTLPHAPRNVTGSYQNNSVTLLWENRAYNATRIEIYRSNNLVGPFTRINPGVTNNQADTSYTDTNVVAGATYYYIVRSVNQYGGKNSQTVKMVLSP